MYRVLTDANMVLQLSYSMELDYDVVGVQGLNAEAVALLRPRVNVSAKGEVPVTLQIFRIRIPCSGLVSAEIPMALRLNVSAPPGTRYNDTTLILRRNKICLKAIEYQVQAAKIEARKIKRLYGIAEGKRKRGKGWIHQADNV
ncbi:hypothetical protein PV326_001987 [Microctonus aethiopoides]|nr:hypothetical protein PV326_001987 [Microctonus aethiopoides]